MFKRYARSVKILLRQDYLQVGQTQNSGFVGDHALCGMLLQDDPLKTERLNGIVKLATHSGAQNVGIGKAVLPLGKNKKDAKKNILSGVKQYLKETTTLVKYVLNEAIKYRQIISRVGLNIQNYELNYQMAEHYVSIVTNKHQLMQEIKTTNYKQYKEFL